MSTLEPKTRTEQFYDAILSGDTSELPTPATREEVYLRQIAENGSGGGSSLPEVTAEDNGKVLSVVEGAWDKADASGGTKVDFFNAGYSGSSVTLLNGKTAGDIIDSLAAGNDVCIVMGPNLELNDNAEIYRFAYSNGPYLVFNKISQNTTYNPTKLKYEKVSFNKTNRETIDGGYSKYNIAIAT